MSNFSLDLGLPFLYSKNEGIISEEMATMIDVVYTGALLLLSTVGIITNFLNIKAFMVIGKEDGISVSLLSLSISDFGYSVSCFLIGVTFIFKRIEKSYDYLFPLDPWVPSSFINQISNVFLAMTVMTTTFLAVTRCMCVVRPLQFSNTFTMSRSIVIHTCIALVSLCGYIPIITQMGVRRVLNVLTNQTRLVTWYSSRREDIKDVVFFLFDTLLTFSVQVVLIICLAIMAHSLRKSGKFRQDNKALESRSENAEKDKQHYKLSGKELQVIEQLVLISAIFIVCSLPRIFSTSYSLIEPDFEVGKRLHNFYFAVTHLRKIFDQINSASTFFIYFSYNSRFRELYRGPKDKN